LTAFGFTNKVLQHSAINFTPGLNAASPPMEQLRPVGIMNTPFIFLFNIKPLDS
jgi:hypothetical protein